MQASLQCEIPDPLVVGGGTALLVRGRLPGPVPAGLELSLGDARCEVTAKGMPDAGRLGAGDLWWALLPIGPVSEPGRRELALEARYADGASARATLASPLLEPAPPSAPAGFDRLPGGEQPLIAVCMATYEPDAAQLQRQIESIRAQSWWRWVCCISDDASSDERFEVIGRIVDGDERFLVSRAERNAGFYRNFERALSMAPAEAELIAPADQDDRWYPDKLEALHDLLAANPGARLGFSDMRMVTESLELISPTYWSARRNNYTDIGSLLIANTVTGAASMLRRELLADALPFPPAPGAAYHDHWLALCALAGGEIAYLDRPTYDRVRHRESITVRAQRGRERPPTRLERLSARWRELRDQGWRPGWRSVYFERYLHLVVLAIVLEARFGERIAARHRRSLHLLVSAADSFRGLAWLLARSTRPWFGRTETMARERLLAGAVVWRRLAGAGARLGRRRATASRAQRG